VKLDDAGLYLCQKPGLGLWTKIQHQVGQVLLRSAPYLMKMLAIVGTAAMFMVGGGILIHGIPAAHHFIEQLAQSVSIVPSINGMLEVLVSSLLNALAGIVAGALALAGVTVTGQAYNRFQHQHLKKENVLH
jgi:predicted DNA repair protein MutK